MSSNQPIVEFNPKLPKLSKKEKDVLKLLVEAGRLIVPLYSKQENQKFPGANLYPHDVTKEEVKNAAKKDPKILSPYTVVEKLDGRLVAIPYHIKYASFLKPIADKLTEASILTENKAFGKALKLQAKVLLDGTYEDATKVWLETKPYILDISIGPTDHFDDHLFFIKASYQAWVGIMDIEGTERLNNYKSIVLSVSRKASIPGERVDNNDKVKAKVLDVVLFSGLMARTKFVGVNLPMEVSIVEKYGSEITLFNQSNDLRIKELIMPTFNKIFPKVFREEFTLEDLRRGYLRAVALHELAHSYLYYKNAAKNLGDIFYTIDELAATALGLRMAGSLLLKDRITSKQLESMIVAFLCRSFNYKKSSRSNYSLRGAIFINFLLKSGALKQSGGMAVPNFMKIFVALQELSDTLELLLAKGTYKEAEAFIERYQN